MKEKPEQLETSVDLLLNDTINSGFDSVSEATSCDQRPNADALHGLEIETTNDRRDKNNLADHNGAGHQEHGHQSSSSSGNDSHREQVRKPILPSVLQSQRPTSAELQWHRQKEYIEFRAKFGKTVADFEKSNPGARLPDYQSMSPEDQVVQQHVVIHLLDRLGIRSKALDDFPILATLDDLDLSKTCWKEQDMSTTTIENPIQPSKPPTNQSWKHSYQKRNDIGENSSSSLMKLQGKKANTQLATIAGASLNHGSFCNNSVAGFSLGDPVLPQESTEFAGVNSPSGSSVEITRRADANHSPPMNLYPQAPMPEGSNSKRLAPASGKRGQDSFRVKLNESLHVYSSDSVGDSMPPRSPSLHSSDDSISSASADAHEDQQIHPFIASQSPIAGMNPENMSQNSPTQKRGIRDKYRESSGTAHWFGDGPETTVRDKHPIGETPIQRRRASSRADDVIRNRHERGSSQQHHKANHPFDDTIVSVNTTALRGRERRTRAGGTTNVALKGGEPFTFHPLHIKRSKRTSQRERNNTGRGYPLHQQVDFRDPFERYVGPERDVLYRVFHWMRDRDNAGRAGAASSPESKGMVFSLDEGHYMNVVIKVLMESGSQSVGRENRSEDVSSLPGQTLIVVRSKENIALWERAFREHTPFTVISYADLPSSERKRSDTASKCAGFNVVITTYDAMKSPDSTVQLDEHGHVALGQEAMSQVLGGWMTKRVVSSHGTADCLGETSQGLVSSNRRRESAVRCKRLSALHHLQWQRIIFNDELGRKCFLAKFETSRAQAAAAVNGNSRFVLLSRQKDESDSSGFQSLMRSDRRAIQSIAAILRIEEDEEDDLLDFILDPTQDTSH